MRNKEKNFISAVVYARNAEETIQNFIKVINEILKEHFLHYEIIIVNDASEDKTVEKVKSCVSIMEDASLSVLNMSHYQGKELSMNAGQDLAIGDFVYEFDSTIIDYNIDVVFETYKKSLEGFDIVNVSSNSKRKLSSKIFYTVFNNNSNYQYKLDTETFRILSRRAINRVHQINKTIPYRKATLANSGLKLTTIRYNSTMKVKGQNDRFTKDEREKNAIDALILFTDVSYKLTTRIIFLLILITLAVLIYTIYIFISSSPIAGWTTTMLFLSFGFLGLFTILAIIIKYLSVLVNLVFRKADYLIESIEKIN